MSTLTFEDAVEEIMQRTGTSRALAEKHVANQLPHLNRLFSSTPTKDENALEKEEQVEIRTLLIAYGFTVRNLSQYRPSKIALGFPDLFVTHNTQPIAFFHETKRQVGGARRPAQVVFAEDCNRCGVRCSHGDRYAVVELLIELEIAVRGPGKYGIEPAKGLLV